jgi:hypothetical protein
MANKKCLNCGGTEFYAEQAVRGSVTVVVQVGADGDATFLRNPTPDGELDRESLNYDDPVGPFVCVGCNCVVVPR